MDHWITVPEVARSMGAVLDSRQAWSVGSAIAAEYHKRCGMQPPKALRPKTSGSGTHCFAVYPPHWGPIIRRAIEAHLKSSARQPDLF